MRASLVALGLSFVLPSAGLGLPLCPFKALLSLPCPGCGVTRSVTCISHGSIAESVRLHPFGPVVYLLLVALAIANFVGQGRLLRLRSWFVGNGFAANVAYNTFIASFLGFGVVRLGLRILAPTWLPTWFTSA